MKAFLYLEDGTIFVGRSFGYEGVSGGELVFNTAMTGYQEVLTDPSYEGQIVLMTYPLIGNYGVNREDMESTKSSVAGFVAREYSPVFSNWRATTSLGDYLTEQKIVALDGVDTRAITRRIRSLGSPRALIGVGEPDLARLKSRMLEVPSMTGLDLATRVACRKPYDWFEGSDHRSDKGAGPKVVVVDCGVKFNILRRLIDEKAQVTVVPPGTSADEILRLSPAGVLVSNGPGDPDAVKGLPQTLEKLLGKLPIFGICLGHQLLGLAIGAKTYKLKFGHHGANHPVRNEKNQRIEITSQNHGFAVDGNSLAKLNGGRFGKVEVTHIHLSDETIEGFALPEIQVRAIQYHPEASPGPHDSNYLFGEFLECIRKRSSE